MKRLVLLFCLLALPALANEIPPEPPGMVWTTRGACSDNSTGKRGMCVIGHDPQGTPYVAFWVKGELEFVRRVKPEGGYEVIYQRVDGTSL